MKMNGKSEKGVNSDKALYGLQNLVPLILTTVLWGWQFHSHFIVLCFFKKKASNMMKITLNK